MNNNCLYYQGIQYRQHNVSLHSYLKMCVLLALLGTKQWLFQKNTVSLPLIDNTVNKNISLSSFKNATYKLKRTIKDCFNHNFMFNIFIRQIFKFNYLFLIIIIYCENRFIQKLALTVIYIVVNTWYHRL